MKVGIIGSGVVGQTLAAGFLKHGHQVEIGTREPAKLRTWWLKIRESPSSRCQKLRRSATLSSWRWRERPRRKR
jgi:predicted dinucleotide-binding enzyme